MALVKLEGYPMAAPNVKKRLRRVPSFLSLLCRRVKTRPRPKMDRSPVTSTEQKSLITKLWTTSCHCGFYVKQYLGTVSKTHIFGLPFTTVSLDPLRSNGNGLQPLDVWFIWTYKRQWSMAWKYVTLLIQVLIVMYWSFSSIRPPLASSLSSMMCGQPKETALGSSVHRSLSLIMIGITSFNILL